MTSGVSRFDVRLKLSLRRSLRAVGESSHSGAAGAAPSVAGALRRGSGSFTGAALAPAWVTSARGSCDLACNRDTWDSKGGLL